MTNDKDSILAKELYNKQFEIYSKKHTAYRGTKDLRKKVYKLLGKIENKKILFIGCGDGLECLPAIIKGAGVTGIDISEKGIDLARKNCPKASFSVMDFKKTNFKTNTFDIIVSILSIMYKKDLVPVFKELRRILKKEGFMMIVVPHPVRKMIKYNNMNYFVKGRKQETWQGIKRFNYYRLFEDYVAAFVKAKLKIRQLIEPRAVLEISHPHLLFFKLIRD